MFLAWPPQSLGGAADKMWEGTAVAKEGVSGGNAKEGWFQCEKGGVGLGGQKSQVKRTVFSMKYVLGVCCKEWLDSFFSEILGRRGRIIKGRKWV